MANEIQKANQGDVYEAIASVTGASPDQIKAFMKAKKIDDPSVLVGDDDLLNELMGQKGTGLATTTASKPPAKRGRGKKGQQAANIETPNYEAPKSGLQAWQQDTNEKLDVVHEELDSYLSEVEESEAGAIVNRFGSVIPNILGIVDAELGRKRGDIASFRSSFRAVLGSDRD